jgi:hypothetical protein
VPLSLAALWVVALRLDALGLDAPRLDALQVEVAATLPSTPSSALLGVSFVLGKSCCRSIGFSLIVWHAFFEFIQNQAD